MKNIFLSDGVKNDSVTIGKTSRPDIQLYGDMDSSYFV